MSNMKDYAMWLDDSGIAFWDNTIGELVVPDSVDIYDTNLVEQYHDDAKWHGIEIEIDEDDYIIDEEEELIIDDGDLDDCAQTPESYWFSPDGGLTGDAYNFLYNADVQGELI